MAQGSTLQLQQFHPLEAGNTAEEYWRDRAASPQWYAVFTLAKHEKRVLERCVRQQVESFLPLYKVKRKWKNRCTVEVELPLFPNYFFVRIVPRNRVPLLQVPGVVSILSSGGNLLPIGDEYIETLREALLVHKIKPHANVGPGERVRITTGPLTGAEGILERHKSGFRVLLKLEMLARTISVEVGTDEIEPCRTRTHWDSKEPVSAFSSAKHIEACRRFELPAK